MNYPPSLPAIVCGDSCGMDFAIEKSFIKRPSSSTSLHRNAVIHGCISMDNGSKTNHLKPYGSCGYGGNDHQMEGKKILRRPTKSWSGKCLCASVDRNTMHHNAIAVEKFKVTFIQTFQFYEHCGNAHKMENNFFKRSTKLMSAKFPCTPLQRNRMLLSSINMEKMKKSSLHTLASSSSTSSSSSSLDASEITFTSAKTMETSGQDEKASSLKGIFPEGLRRAEVKIPGLAMNVRVIDILGPESKDFVAMVDSLVASGFTMVILQSREEGCEDGGSVSGARLFEAARLLKNLLRGRATFLVEERVDIASAAGADGVLISDEGLPGVVARSMMQNANSDSVVLPLVARSVTSAQSALLATTSEGADFLLLQTPQDDLANIINTVTGRVSIPVFSQESMSSVSSIFTNGGTSFESLEAGATGIVYNAIDLKILAADKLETLMSSLLEAMIRVQPKSAGVSRSTVSDLKELPDIGTAKEPVSVPKLSLDLQVKEILEEERSVLESLIILMKEAYPEMEEVSLLIDAVAQLDEPFLLMVVGEFNSGKSSVINALLGKRYLAEGVLPTTNEIALLKHADVAANKERSERHPDGHFMYYLPAELLKEINIVDTPGTNVILKRQQRLTEEFLPRADLVLFVLSADRPFTESEMAFLRYIRQWDKKIIFLLNKSDIYLDTKELEEVVKFVQDNAQQTLSLEQTTIYAVSARQAFQAKAAIINDDGTLNTEQLQKNLTWNSSGFQKLEEFITDFLSGSSDAGAERRRLKLATPLGISVTLLEVCDRQLSMESKKADSDLEVLQGLLKQLDDYQKTMESNGSMDRQQLFALVEATKVRADRFVDSVLRVSNIDAVARYLLGGDRTGTLPVAGSFDEQVLGSVLSDVKSVLERHSTSLENSLKQQVSSYRELLMNRWPNVNLKMKYIGQNMDKYEYIHTLKPVENISIRVLNGFDTQAAKIVLEQELRDVVFSTFGGLGAAGVSASVLTSILPSTVEDLLALALCSAGGLVGVWNLPNRRSEVKRKVKKVADAVASQIGVAMEADLKDTITQLRKEVEEMMEPYIESAQAEVDRVMELRARVEIGKAQLEHLRMRVQNLRY